MFGGRFSHTRFSLRDKYDLDARINVFFTESIRSLISLGQDVPIAHDFFENIDGEVTATQGVKFSNNFEETIDISAAGVRNFALRVSFAENISSNIHLSSNIAVRHNFKEDINAKIFLAKNVRFKHDFQENINMKALLGSNVAVRVFMSEEVFGKISSIMIDEDTILISGISIPPGGELRIDSENFIVLANGVNVIHLYNEQWLNISRETLEMTVTASGVSGTGKMNGRLLYLERYL